MTDIKQKQTRFKDLVVNYVMHFGKKVDDSLQTFISENWDWGLGYKTKTSLLNGSMHHKDYNRQKFVQRLRQAEQGDQAMSFIKFQEVQVDGGIVKWKGKFICGSGFSASPNYQIQSFFSPEGKFLQQWFTQLQEQSKQQTAPQISWKDAKHFRALQRQF